MFLKGLWRVALYATRITIAGAMAFLLWGASIYYVPSYVVFIGRYADQVERAIVRTLESFVPWLAALMVSVPVTPNLVFLTYFLPMLLLVHLVGSMFKRT